MSIYVPEKNIPTNVHVYFPLDPNQGYSWSQGKMNSQSEMLYSYNAIGKTMVDMMVRRVVGEGLTPMSSPESDILEWKPERLEAFQRQAESFWRLITGAPDFDYYGKDNFRDIQKIACKMALKDGDFLAHWGYRKLRNGTVVPYIQLISGKAVKSPNLTDTKEIIGGVEIDQTTGKETGYYLATIDSNLNETGDKKRVSRRTSRGRLEYELIQLQKSDASMVRGIPLLMCVRDIILDVFSYMRNHVVQSATQAIFTLFIERAKDAPDSMSSFAERFIQSGAEAHDEEGVTTVELAGGNVVMLDEGEHANPVQRQAMGDDFQAYMKSVIGLVASSLGMSYEVAMSTYDASFSASRASINATDINFSIIRREFSEKFCTPTWRQIVEYGILSGHIDCPEWESLTGLQKKALLGVTWIGAKSPQVDPTREVSAYEKAINLGICSKEYATRTLFGLDYEEVKERVEAESAGNSEKEEAADNTDKTKDRSENNDGEGDDEQ